MNKHAVIDKNIFIPSIIVLVFTIAYIIFFGGSAKIFIDRAFDYITNQLGFIYIWAGALFFCTVGWLGFGRYGSVRLGGDQAKPEFSRLSWIGMFFCSGVGTSIMYWGAVEWSYYYVAPPFGIAAKSTLAAEYAATYGIFHSGPIAWALLSITAFPIGYAYYNRRSGSLRLSSACAGFIGKKHANGPVGKVIDILMIFGLVGGTGTSLASGTPMLAEAISHLFHLSHNFYVDVAVVIIWTAIFMTSVALGLKKGIKVLSDVNIIALSILGAILFFGGATYFMLNTFTNSMGILITDFARMAFSTDPIAQQQFPQHWTIFYWAWWIAYAPFLGMFIARISKGRTFRDIAITVVLSGSIGCALFYVILGDNMLFSELNHLYPVIDTIHQVSPSAAILAVLEQQPLAWLILPLFIFVGFVYSGTTVDSSAYVLASITSQKMTIDQEPNRFNRIFWASLLGLSALVLMNIGGLDALKTASLMVALPLVFIMGMSFISLLKWLKEDIDFAHTKGNTQPIHPPEPSKESHQD